MDRQRSPYVAQGGVAAEQGAAQEDRTLFTAMTDSTIVATSMIQRCIRVSVAKGRIVTILLAAPDRPRLWAGTLPG